jgi:hypothetical protein
MPDKAPSARETIKTTNRHRADPPARQSPVILTEQANPLALQRAIDDPGAASPRDILALQRLAGNRAVTRLIQSSGKLRMQAKLTVGPAGDKYEQEADRVAEQVVSGQLSAVNGQTSNVKRQAEDEEEVQTKLLATSITPLVQRQAEEEEEVQTKSNLQPPTCNLQASFDAGPNIESRLAASRGSGSPLPGEVRAAMEPRFGADFGGVRVHTGGEADQLNRQLSAQAFTHGQDIYMAAGKYAPGTTAGNRLLAHELTHVVQQTGKQVGQVKGVASRAVIQRVLSLEDIIAALKNIDFVNKKLQAPRFVEHKAEGTMEDHIRVALGKYRTLFPTGVSDEINQAMMLTMAIDGVLKVIAEELYDPWIQPLLAEKLWEFYGDKIKEELGKKGMSKEHQESAAKLAKVMTPGNPVAQYMHHDEKKETCAQKIREMAVAANNMPADQMFDLLNKQFQAEMASYTRDQIARTEDKQESYNIRETPGQLSERYFKELFGDVAAPPETVGMGLTFGGPNAKGRTPQQRLDALKTAVMAMPPASGGPLALRPGVKTEKQERHLQKIEGKETGGEVGAARDALKLKYMGMFGLTDPQAARLVGEIETWLDNAPLTITVEGEDWFGRTWYYLWSNPPQAGTGETKFKPATAWHQSTEYSKVFGKEGSPGSIEHLGKYTHPKYAGERGERYLRFRKWKDYKETSRLGFESEELPTFGAVNVQWEKSKGSEFGEPAKYGKNYYGNTHFKLKKANIQNRMVYTATDHGRPRRKPLLALRDFAVGGETLLKLKVQHPNTKMLAMVADAAMRLDNNFVNNLPFEIQVFGDVDIATDVEHIYLAPGISWTVSSNLEKFKKQTGVPYTILTKPTTALVELSGKIINTVKSQVPSKL